MKKIVAGVFLTVFLLAGTFSALAAGSSTKTAPRIVSVSGNGADISVSWTEPEWSGLDSYEVQLGRTNENGTSFRAVKTARTDSSETVYDFTATQRGYYTARVRARDVDGKDTAWSGNGTVVVVNSEDVSGGGGPFHTDSSRGPGVKRSEGAANGSENGGPGVSGAYSSSAAGETRRRVRVNTYTANGWQSDNVGRWYLFPDGSYPVNCWEKLDGKFYHFDDSGYMEWNRWVKESDGSWRFCVASGEMAVGWNDISGKWYYMEPANGVMLGGGEHAIGGRLYYMNAGGDRVQSAWAGGHYYGSDGARA